MGKCRKGRVGPPDTEHNWKDLKDGSRKCRRCGWLQFVGEVVEIDVNSPEFIFDLIGSGFFVRRSNGQWKMKEGSGDELCDILTPVLDRAIEGADGKERKP